MKLECSTHLKLSDLLRSYADENKLLVAIYLGMLLIIPLRDILFSHLFGDLFDFQKKDRQIYNLLIFIVLAIIVFTILYVIDSMLETNVGTGFEQHVKLTLMSKVLANQNYAFKEIEVGRVLKRITEIPQTIFWFVSFIRERIAPLVMLSLGVIIYFIFLNQYLALLVGVIIVIYSVFIYYAFTICSKHAERREESSATIMEKIDDVFRNVITVLNFDQQEHERLHIHNYHNRYKNDTIRSINCTLYSSIVAMVIILLVVLAFLYAGVKWNLGQLRTMPIAMKITSATLVGLLLNFMYGTAVQIKYITLRYGNVKNSLTVFKNCVLSEDPSDYVQHEIPNLTLKNMDLTNKIHLQNITYTYTDEMGQSRPIFKDVTFSIPMHQHTLILGKNGAGKSTLLSLLMKYQLPKSGEIYLEGVPYSRLSHTEIRTRIGYIPQNTILFNRSVYDNIVYGLNPVPSQEQIVQLFHELKQGDILTKFPKGLDTLCGKLGSHLSGGQRQIITIIRMFLLNPDIVILDEPTSAIDEATKERVVSMLVTLMAKKTVLMVTHDTHLIKQANHVIQIENGIIIEVR